MIILGMHLQPSTFDAWQAIKKNQSTIEYLKSRISYRRSRFKELCNDVDMKQIIDTDEVMTQAPDLAILDDDGTQKLLTVLEAESLPMTQSTIQSKCNIENQNILQNSLKKLSYQNLITLKGTDELNVVSIEAKKVTYSSMKLSIDFLV